MTEPSPGFGITNQHCSKGGHLFVVPYFHPYRSRIYKTKRPKKLLSARTIHPERKYWSPIHIPTYSRTYLPPRIVRDQACVNWSLQLYLRILYILESLQAAVRSFSGIWCCFRFLICAEKCTLDADDLWTLSTYWMLWTWSRSLVYAVYASWTQMTSGLLTLHIWMLWTLNTP